MLTVYEFKLNYAKIHNSGHFGHCGTSTTLFGIGTDCILMGGTGTAWIGTGTAWIGTGTAWISTGTAWLLMGRYRYRSVSVPVPLREFAQNCFFLQLLVPILFIQLLYSIIPQKPHGIYLKTTPQHLNW